MRLWSSGDRVVDTAQKAFGGGTSPEIFKEQLIVRFALGCHDGKAGKQGWLAAH